MCIDTRRVVDGKHFDVSAEEMRNIYLQFLITRIQWSAIFVKEAQHARESFI
ncbi:MAG: hypothetical protein WDM90_14010 [Ferruginibacter sp.]